MKILQTTKDSNGYYNCPIDITANEWLSLVKKLADDTTIDLLLRFLRSSDHKSTCSIIGERISPRKSHQAVQNKIVAFAKAVQQELKIDVRGTNGEPTFWIIPMTGRTIAQGSFEWRLRDELATALKMYQDELVQEFLKQYPLESLSSMKLSEYTNLERNNSFCYWVEIRLKVLGNIQGAPSYKFGIYEYNNLSRTDNEQYSYDDKYAWQNRFGDTSKKAYNQINKLICEIASLAVEKNYVAIEAIDFSPMYKWKIAYLYSKQDLIPLFKKEMLEEAAKAEGMSINRDTAIYEMQKYLIKKRGSQDKHEYYYRLLRIVNGDAEDSTINFDTARYWLAGYAWGSIDSQMERFKKEGIWAGSGSQAVNRKIEQLKTGDILILKATATKGKDHKTPFLRVRALAIVLSDKPTFNSQDYEVKVKYIDIPEKEFEGPSFGKYRQTIHECDNQEIIDYISQYLNTKHMAVSSKYADYIELLKENYNLVLTGAPGTGKTHMAQAIAIEMDAVPQFVQFHPSYDYTDFVEGLRPVENGDGQIGFERKDGVFKAFCKEAIKNLIDSNKSIESLTKEQAWQLTLEQFIDDTIESGNKLETVNGSKFVITDVNDDIIRVFNQQNAKSIQVRVSINEVLTLLVEDAPLNHVSDIKEIFGRKVRTQPDSYTYAIVKAIRAMKKKTPVVEANKVNRKPFVFIIDEINRGEASKIFGELFYAIDPGYRGKKDILVKTQYQNLVPEDDVFAKGFYVPENVYILATMNDIDRSVESMDFAMRRRFTWKEVTPNDTEYMLDKLPCAIEAKSAMNRLNKVIAETDGLGAAFSIGPSYFLKLEKNGGSFDKLWTMNIEPLLKEYLRGMRKSDEILKKYHKAFFDTKEETTDKPELIDED